jgi:two-component system LytT family sensor kinase
MLETTSIPTRWLSFWPLQIGGWFLYVVLTLFSYSSYLQSRFDKVSEDVSLIFAFLASFVLYALCRLLWRRRASIAACILASMVASYLLASTGSILLGTARFAGTHDPVTLAKVSAGSFCNAIVLVTWCAFYFGIKHYLASEERFRRLQASELAAREAQLQALQYQLQPHFLFNTLNAISSLEVSDQKQAATQMISRLGDLLRHTLETPQAAFATFAEELALIDEYLSAERTRFGARLRVTLDIDNAAYDAVLPKWLLQPLIENAIRHGISRLPNGGEVVLRARVDQPLLLLTIENDLGWEQEANAPPRSGVGLQNTRARLLSLYGDSGSLTAVRQKNGRYVVSIRMPYSAALAQPELASIEALR